MSKEDTDNQETVECPTCPKEFATTKSMKIHHARVHGESIAGELIECEWCGDTRRVEPNKIERRDHLFCGRECRSEWLSTRTGEQSTRWIGDEAMHECEWCSGEFRKAPSQLENPNRKFCSQECYQSWKQDWGRVEHTCEQCGDTFTTQRNGNSKGRFCGYECTWEWLREEKPLSERFSGKGHPQWKGGYATHRGTGWQGKREKVLEIEGYQCQACGMTESDHQEEFGRGLDIHHIQPAVTFDDPDKADAVDNLVPLCVKCHRKWEGIPLRPQLAD